MAKQSSQGKALITGASSGIGAVYADRLAKRGYDLILVARDVSRLKSLAERLEKEALVQVEVLGADLTRKQELLKVEQVLKIDPRITLLINNAGMASATPFAETDTDQLENMISLNVTALTRLASAAVPGFIKRGSGTMINIASIVALAPGMVSGTYSATKAFVLNLSQALHDELNGKGIQIQAVLPGATRTELWSRGGVDINTLPQDWIMSTEDMVDASLVGLDRKEVVTIPALQNVEEWNKFEAARKAMTPNLSKATPARRYA